MATPSQILAGVLGSSSDPGVAGQGPGDVLRETLAPAPQKTPSSVLRGILAPTPLKQQDPFFEDSISKRRREMEAEQQRIDEGLHDIASRTRWLPGIGNIAADLFDPAVKEKRAMTNPLLVPTFFSQGGGAAWNYDDSLHKLLRDVPGPQPSVEAQTSDLLGPSTRSRALQRGMDLPDLAAVPPRSTAQEEIERAAQEKLWLDQGALGRVDEEEAKRIYERNRLTPSEVAEIEAGARRKQAAEARGFSEEFADNLGPRAVDLAMGATPRGRVSGVAARAKSIADLLVPPPAKRAPVSGQNVAAILSAEQGDAQQAGADRFIQGSRTPLPTAYDAVVESGGSPLAGLALETAVDPLTWTDALGAPLASGLNRLNNYELAARELSGDLARGFERGLAEAAPPVPLPPKAPPRSAMQLQRELRAARQQGEMVDELPAIDEADAFSYEEPEATRGGKSIAQMRAEMRQPLPPPPGPPSARELRQMMAQRQGQVVDTLPEMNPNLPVARPIQADLREAAMPQRELSLPNLTAEQMDDLRSLPQVEYPAPNPVSQESPSTVLSRVLGSDAKPNLNPTARVPEVQKMDDLPAWQRPNSKNRARWQKTVSEADKQLEARVRKAVAETGADESAWRAHYREMEPESIKHARANLATAQTAPPPASSAPAIDPAIWSSKSTPGAIPVRAEGKTINVRLSTDEIAAWRWQTPAERRAAIEERALAARPVAKDVPTYRPPQEVGDDAIARELGLEPTGTDGDPGRQLREWRERRAQEQPPTPEQQAKSADRAARQDEFHRQSLELVQAHTPVPSGKGRLKPGPLETDPMGRPYVDMGQRRYFLTEGEARYYNDLPPDVDKAEWLKLRQHEPKEPLKRAHNALPEGQAEIPETGVDELIPEGSPLKGKPAPPVNDKKSGINLIDERAPEPVREAEATVRKAKGDDELPDGILESVDPSTVKTDAKAYQYKSGGDSAGVTGRLHDVDRWVSARSGKVVIHERLDGTRYIADGHQRLELAQRAQAAGQPNVRLDAMIYREADGWTADDIRLLAAQKNMAENSGTAIDAAKIIREAGMDNPDIKNLPRSSAVVRDGEQLAKLSEPAFDMVVNELVRPDQAAFVGKLITDPAEQVAALKALRRVKASSAAEAESIVQDLRVAGFAKRNEGLPAGLEQGGLFGDEDLFQLEDLLGERAQVVAATAKRIKNDKALFRKLVDQEGRASEVGNKLDRAANEARLTDDERILQGLQQAKYVGPVADALNRAAREVRDGSKSFTKVIDDFSKAVGEHLEGRSLDRGSARAAESLDTSGAGSLRPKIEPRLNGLDFEPNPGKGWDSNRAPQAIGQRKLTPLQKERWPEMTPAQRRKMMGAPEPEGRMTGLDFEQGDLFDAYEVHGTQVQLGGGKAVQPLPLRAWVNVTKDLTGKAPAVDEGLRALGKELGGFAKGRARGNLLFLNPDLFKDLDLAAWTLSHEIGHLPALLPPSALPKEGVMADLVTLKRSMSSYYGSLPDDVRKELWGVTRAWRPFNEKAASAKFLAYRRQTDEMFADAISMLMNDPAQLEKKAPKFHANLMKQMETQPKLQQVMADLQNWRSGNLADLDEGIRQRIAAGMLKPQEMMEAIAENAQLRKQNVMERIRQQVVAKIEAAKELPVKARMKLDVGAPLKDRAAKLEREGKLVRGSDVDARATWDEYHYGTPEVALDSHDWQKGTLDVLDEAKVDENTFDRWMLYDGVSKSRGKSVAFPEGVDADFAENALKLMRKDLSPEQVKALQKATKNARKMRVDALTELHESGFLSDKDFKRIKADADGFTPTATHTELRNKTDFIKQIREEVGTLDEANMSPSVKTLMQNVEMRKMAHENRSRKRVVDLYRLDGEDLGPGPGKKPFKFWEDGEEKTIHVDPYVDELFSKLPTAQKSSLTQLSSWTDKLFRAGYITYNIRFPFNQLPKDIQRSARNLAAEKKMNPVFALLQTGYDFAAHLPAAWRYAKGDLDDPLVRKAIKEQAIPLPGNSFLGEMRGGTEQVMSSVYSAAAAKTSSAKRNPIAQKLSDAWKTWWDFSQAVEVLPKLSAQGRLKDLSRAERAAITRDLIGTPNTRVKGEWTSQTNGLMMFANVIMQGMRSDLRVALQPKSRAGFVLQAAMVTVPTVLNYAAQQGWLNGAFGKDVQDAMKRVPNDVKRDKIVVPVGVTPSGQVIYYTLAKDDLNKHLGAIVWNALTANDDYAEKNARTWAEGFVGKNARYIPNLFPGLSPTLKDAGRWSQAFSDQAEDAPEDDFGRPILSQNEMLAPGTLGWRKWRGMLRYQLGAMGRPGKALRGFAFEDDRPVAVSETSWPMAEVTDYGLKEAERKAETAEKRVKAERRLDYSRETRNVLSTYSSLQNAERNPKEMRELGYGPQEVARRTRAFVKAKEAKRYFDGQDKLMARLVAAGKDEEAAKLRERVDAKMATYDKQINELTGKSWR